MDSKQELPNALQDSAKMFSLILFLMIFIASIIYLFVIFQLRAHVLQLKKQHVTHRHQPGQQIPKKLLLVKHNSILMEKLVDSEQERLNAQQNLVLM